MFNEWTKQDRRIDRMEKAVNKLAAAWYFTTKSFNHAWLRNCEGSSILLCPSALTSFCSLPTVDTSTLQGVILDSMACSRPSTGTFSFSLVCTVPENAGPFPFKHSGLYVVLFACFGQGFMYPRLAINLV